VTGDGIASRTLVRGASFHIDFKEALPLADVIDLASYLQNLVSIGTDQPAVFERFWLWHPAFYRERSDGQHVRTWLEFLAEWRAQPSEHKRPPTEYDMAFTFTQLGGIDAITI